MMRGSIGSQLKLGVCAAIVGCGLAEYEAQMDKAQKRLEYIDKENIYLGEPLEPPPQEKTTAADGSPKLKPKIDLFFRPPKGIMPKYEATPLGTLLYRYLKEPKSSPLARSVTPQTGKLPPEFQEVLVATSADRSRDDFWKEVLAPFPGVETNGMTRETKQPPGRAPLPFDRLSFNVAVPPASYFILVYQVPPSTQVAVVFNVNPELEANPEVAAAMDYSLKSLGVGPEAAQLRQRHHPAN